MEAITDLQTARELEDLWRMVSDGVNRANAVLGCCKGYEKRLLELAVWMDSEGKPSLRRSVDEAKEAADNVAREQSQVQATLNAVATETRALERLHNEIGAAVRQLGGPEALDRLRREHHIVSTGLSVAQQRIQQFEGEVRQVKGWLDKLEAEGARAQTLLKGSQQLVDEATEQARFAQASLKAALASGQEAESHAEAVRAVRAEIEAFGGPLALEAIRDDQGAVNIRVRDLGAELAQLQERLQGSEKNIKSLAGGYGRLKKWTVGTAGGMAVALLVALSARFPLGPARLDAAAAHPAPVASPPVPLAGPAPAVQLRHGRRRGRARRRATLAAPEAGGVAGKVLR